METKNSRRQFFLRAGQLLGVAVVAPTVLSSIVMAEERRRPRPTEGGAAAGGGSTAAAGGGDLSQPMADPNVEPAKSMNYVYKHADLKKPELKIEKQGVKWEKQFCKDCTFYKAAGNKDGKTVGNCTALGNKLVLQDAWCASWTKRA